jgi:hypothetical protein
MIGVQIDTSWANGEYPGLSVVGVRGDNGGANEVDRPTIRFASPIAPGGVGRTFAGCEDSLIDRANGAAANRNDGNYGAGSANDPEEMSTRETGRLR